MSNSSPKRYARPALPIPEHFRPDAVDQVWRVPYGERAVEAAAWAALHRVRPASEDTLRVCLLLVDVQNTFCTPGFELFVGPSAVEDSRRTCEFIYRNMGAISRISATLDTHTAMQIFHAIFFIDASGDHPAPGSQISAEDIESGRWRVNPAVAHSVARGDMEGLERHVRHYVRTLAESGRYALSIWPYHAMLGGIGHALVSAVEEACFFHGIARRSQVDYQVKGNHPLTENYSILQPEVMTGPDGTAIAERNTHFLRQLISFDRIVIAGQAKSHCVAWTVDDLLSEIKVQDGALTRKVYILEDCTSPVVIPGVVDFSEQADLAFRRFAEAGVNIVRSTDPMEEWPDFAPR